MNAKKLEKAEARLKAKQEKRLEKDTLRPATLCELVKRAEKR